MNPNDPVVTCACGELFPCDRRFVGGYVNCPRCGKAVAVPGLRDGWWRMTQLGALASLALVVVVAWRLGGPAAALLAALAGALTLWILSRAF